MLQTAGWSQLPWGVHAVGVNVIHRGPQRPLAGIAAAQNVEIHLDQQKQVILAPAAAALVVALNDLGVEAQIVPPNIANTNTDAVHILVGPKR